MFANCCDPRQYSVVSQSLCRSTKPVEEGLERISQVRLGKSSIVQRIVVLYENHTDRSPSVPINQGTSKDPDLNDRRPQSGKRTGRTVGSDRAKKSSKAAHTDRPIVTFDNDIPLCRIKEKYFSKRHYSGSRLREYESWKQAILCYSKHSLVEAGRQNLTLY